MDPVTDLSVFQILLVMQDERQVGSHSRMSPLQVGYSIQSDHRWGVLGKDRSRLLESLTIS